MAKSRNAKCSCGSGKKYKLCHGRREQAERSGKSNSMIAIAAIAILAFAVFGVVSVFSSRGGDGSGRVWSAEHGHWHGPDGREIQGVTSPGSAVPPGPPPEPGKVWSPEHNHWH